MLNVKIIIMTSYFHTAYQSKAPPKLSNFQFLAYAYRELWPSGKNDPSVLQGFE